MGDTVIVDWLTKSTLFLTEKKIMANSEIYEAIFEGGGTKSWCPSLHCFSLG